MNKESYSGDYHGYLTREPNIVNPKSNSEASNYLCVNLNITDRFGIYPPVSFTVQTVHYERTFAPVLANRETEDEEGESSESDFIYKPKAYTFIVPYKFYLKANNGAKLYRYLKVDTDDDGVSTVSFQEVDIKTDGYYKPTAGMPYYLVVESGDPFTLESSVESTVQQGSNGGGYSTEDYGFSGTSVPIDNEHLYNPDMPKYILQSDGNWHRVPQNQPKAYGGAFRCYFYAKTNQAARTLVTCFGDGDETGIHQTVMRTIDHDGTEHYYNLNGHRLSGKPQQGIYIHQGKKHIAK